MEIITTQDIGVDPDVITGYSNIHTPSEADSGDERDWHKYPEGGNVPEIQIRVPTNETPQAPPTYEVPVPDNAPIWPDRNGNYEDFEKGPDPITPEVRGQIGEVLQCGLWDNGGRVGNWEPSNTTRERRSKKPKPRKERRGDNKKPEAPVDRFGVQVPFKSLSN